VREKRKTDPALAKAHCEHNKASYRRHAEKERAQARAYYRADPAKYKLYARLRKNRLRANGGTLTRAEWLALCDKYDGRCLACGEKKPLTIDHVIPVSKGGRHSIENVQPLCRVCNNRKRCDTTDYRP
jgi:5-methylcytosine-specific restriction endonuclease McrA